MRLFIITSVMATQQSTEIEKGNILQYIQPISKRPKIETFAKLQYYSLLLCFVALDLSRHLERFICFIQNKNKVQITWENSFLFILKFRCSWCKNFSLLLMCPVFENITRQKILMINIISL